MCIAFSNKFATQSIGSLLVGATPVILKGWRHVSSWFLAFALVQIAPRDVVYDALTRHVFLAFVVKVGAALYKQFCRGANLNFVGVMLSKSVWTSCPHWGARRRSSMAADAVMLGVRSTIDDATTRVVGA